MDYREGVTNDRVGHTSFLVRAAPKIARKLGAASAKTAAGATLRQVRQKAMEIRSSSIKQSIKSGAITPTEIDEAVIIEQDPIVTTDPELDFADMVDVDDQTAMDLHEATAHGSQPRGHKGPARPAAAWLLAKRRKPDGIVICFGSTSCCPYNHRFCH